MLRQSLCMSIVDIPGPPSKNKRELKTFLRAESAICTSRLAPRHEDGDCRLLEINAVHVGNLCNEIVLDIDGCP